MQFSALKKLDEKLMIIIFPYDYQIEQVGLAIRFLLAIH